MRISKVFSDGAVLQRGKEIILVGETELLSAFYYQREQNDRQVSSSCDTHRITAQLGTCQAEAKIEKDGFFQITFPAMEAGGPYTIEIKEYINTSELVEKIVINSILIGDVFLLSGQSNMELPVGRTLDLYADEVKNVTIPDMRFYQIPRTYYFDGPKRMAPEGNWVSVTQETIYGLSAIGFFFGRMLKEQEDVPLGFLATGVGGAHIEAFLKEETLIRSGEKLREDNILAHRENQCSCDKNGCCSFCYDKRLSEDRNAEWIDTTKRKDMLREVSWYTHLKASDPGVREEWESSEWTQSDGKIEIPGMWDYSHLGKMYGSVWLQKTVEVPESFSEGEVQLRLGTLVDGDRTYINGQQVGSTGYRYPPRRYAIKQGILKPGKNVITVCVILTENVGGAKPDMPYCLKKGEEEIRISGEWAYRIGAVTERLEGATFFEWKPCGLYNGTIYPYQFLRLSGILFYQGESNSSHPEDYEVLMRAMIQDFRELFGEKVPMVFAQLPDFMGEGDEIGTDRWDRLRRSQKKAAMQPYTALAVLYDLGQYNELHPQNKKEVAKRFLTMYNRLVSDN